MVLGKKATRIEIGAPYTCILCGKTTQRVYDMVRQDDRGHLFKAHPGISGYTDSGGAEFIVRSPKRSATLTLPIERLCELPAAKDTSRNNY
jgi:hypothetical protein